MYDLSGVTQSISFVALSGTDIMGACAILGGVGCGSGAADSEDSAVLALS